MVGRDESLFSVVQFYTFPTRTRQHFFMDLGLRVELEGLFLAQCESHGFCLLGSAVVSDHVHLLIRHGAKRRARGVMWLLKGSVSHIFLERHPEIRMDLMSRGLWASGFHYKRISEARIPFYVQYCRNQYQPDGNDKRWV